MAISIRTSYDDAVDFIACVPLTEDPEEGIAIWTRADQAPMFNEVGGKEVLCGFTGLENNICDQQRSEDFVWAHYTVRKMKMSGEMEQASDDMRAYTLSAGEHDMWMLGSPRDLPYAPGTSFERICRHGPQF